MKGLISFSLFIVIAIIVWWTVTEDFSDSRRLQQVSDKPYIEVFMNTFELTAMNEKGMPNYKLTGTRLQRFNNTDNTEVELPVFHLLQNNSQWTISADNALLNNKNKTILLNENVLMQQQNIEPAVHIRTQTLLIHTDTQIAQTQARVNITQGQSQLESNGMIFNNITSELELSSNVNGYLLPHE